MIPVDQTVLEPPLGNCWDACIASIFEIPLESVPHYYGDDWDARYREWLAVYNLGFITLEVESAYGLVHGYAILAADSPRFPGKLHAVVLHNGEIVHDPHPGRDAGVGEWHYIDLFYVLDPSKPVTIGDLREGGIEWHHIHSY